MKILHIFGMLVIVCGFTDMMVESLKCVRFKYKKEIQNGYMRARLVLSKSKRQYIALRLKPTDVVATSTPVWNVSVTETGTSLLRKTNPYIPMDSVQFYEDSSQMAALRVYEYRGYKEFTGVVGKWKIEPSRNVRCRFHDNTIANTTETDSIVTTYHIISDLSELGEHKPQNLKQRKRTKALKRPKRFIFNHMFDGAFDIYRSHKLIEETPEVTSPVAIEEPAVVTTDINERSIDTVYLDILLITDYNQKFTTRLKRNQFIDYLITYWTAVSLRFREFTNPHIRLRIVGIVIATSRKSLPIYENDETFIRANNQHWIKIRKWLKTRNDTIPLDSYGMVVILTTSKLCQAGGACNQIELTFKTGAQCLADGSNSLQAISIVPSTYLFDGILGATHGLGHILGAGHDGPPHNSACPAKARQIMSNFNSKAMNSTWSECSKIAISQHFTFERVSCFGKEQHWSSTGEPMYKTLSLLEQCQHRGYKSACKVEGEICSKLSCWDPVLSKCNNTGPAMEGTSSFDGFCRNGIYVPKIIDSDADYDF